MKKVLLLALIFTFVGCKNHLSKEELLANSLDRQDGFTDVEVLRTFTADDGQEYVALQWKNQDDCCIEETYEHAGVFNLTHYNPLRSWDHYVRTIWNENPFNDANLDNIDPEDDSFQEITYGNDVQLHTGLSYNPVTDEYQTEIDGTEYVFTEQSSSSKDLEAMGALVESKSSQALAHELVSNYGFSEERGKKIAQTFSTFKRIQKSRNLTDKDLNSFSELLLGSNYNTAKEAITSLAQGETEGFESLVEKASAHNSVSPEEMKAVINSMIINN